MALFSDPRDAGGRVTPGALLTPEVRPERPETGFVDALGPAFRRSNIVGSLLADDRPDRRAFIDPDFDPIEHVPETHRQYATAYAWANNIADVARITAQIDREMRDRDILERAGTSGFVAEMAMGVLDPSIFVPVFGGARLTGTVGRRALGGFGSTALGSIPSIAAQQAGLLASQETRTLEESALEMGGGVLLSGALGSALSVLLGRRAAAGRIRRAEAPAEAPRSSPSQATPEARPAPISTPADEVEAMVAPLPPRQTTMPLPNGAAFKIGDDVQWSPGGTEMWGAPRRVRSISPDGRYVYVEGLPGGLPSWEVSAFRGRRPPSMERAPERPPSREAQGETTTLAKTATETAPADVPAERPALPRDLVGAKPRFGMGEKNFRVEFESDVDKALFIIAQGKKSARDADYRGWLKSLGFSDAIIDMAGAAVRQRIKALAGHVADDTIRVADSGLFEHLRDVQRPTGPVEQPSLPETAPAAFAKTSNEVETDLQTSPDGVPDMTEPASLPVRNNDAGTPAAVAPADAPEPSVPWAGEQPVALPPKRFLVDAKRFQFKAGADEIGVTERLRGVKQWDPKLAGMVLGWEDKDGKIWIVDGHQRHALAARLEKQGQSPHLNAIIMREADGISAESAMVAAAFKNIAEGTGSAADAAKIIRLVRTNADLKAMAERGTLPPLPPASALVRDAHALANLGDEAFGMVINGVVPENYAAHVGRLLEVPAEQAAALRVLAKAEPANTNQARLIVEQIKAAGFSKTEQTDLFGGRDIAQSLIVERAKILDASAKRLRQEIGAFRIAVEREGLLQTAGNVLSHEANVKRLTDDQAVLEILKVLANRKGPVADALNAGAARLAGGEKPGSVVEGFVEAVREASRKGTLDGGESSGSRPGSEAGGSQVVGILPSGKVGQPATERTAQGDQFVLAGTERIGQKEQAERELAKPLRPETAQKPADEGLFDVSGRDQTDLLDVAAKKDEQAPELQVDWLTELAAKAGLPKTLDEARAAGFTVSSEPRGNPDAPGLAEVIHDVTVTAPNGVETGHVVTTIFGHLPDEELATKDSIAEWGWREHLRRATGQPSGSEIFDIVPVRNAEPPAVDAIGGPVRSEAQRQAQAQISNVAAKIAAGEKVDSVLPLGAVRADVAGKIVATAKAEGHDVALGRDAAAVVESRDLARIWERRGPEAPARAESELAVGIDDFRRIPEVLADPENVSLVTRNADGMHAVVLSREYSDGIAQVIVAIDGDSLRVIDVAKRPLPPKGMKEAGIEPPEKLAIDVPRPAIERDAQTALAVRETEAPPPIKPPDDGGSTVGAMMVHQPTFIAIKRAFGLERVLGNDRWYGRIFGNPIIRAIISPAQAVRRIAADLSETPFYLEANAAGGPSPQAVESSIKRWYGELDFTVREMDRLWRQHRETQHGTLTAAGDLLRGTPAGKLPYEEFRRQIGVAMINGDRHEIPQVAEAARVFRQRIFDPLKEKSIEHDLLPEGVAPQTAVGYLSRIYEVDKIAAQRETWLSEVVIPWLMEGQQGSARVFQSFEEHMGGLRARMDRLHAQRERVLNQMASQEPMSPGFRPFRELDADLKRIDKEILVFEDFAQRVRAEMDEMRPWVTAAHQEIRDMAEQITDHILGHPGGRSPYQVIPLTRGPLKERTFNIPDERLLAGGWLDTNIERVARYYLRTVAPDVELTARFGRADLRDQIEDVNRDYQRLIASAGDGAKAAALDQRWRSDVDDIEALRDRIRHMYAAPTSVGEMNVRRAANIVKDVNYLRLMGGLLWASIPDAGHIVKIHGIRRTLESGLLPLISDWQGVKMNMAEAQRIGQAIDMTLNTRAMTLADIGDEYGRRTRFERGLHALTAKFGLINIFSAWNTATKTIAYMTTQARLADAAVEAARSGRISAADREYFAMLGIRSDAIEAEVIPIGRELLRHGDKRGALWTANADRWENRGLADKWELGLTKEIDRIIVTPGVGDKPLWTSESLGGVVNQFRGFGQSAAMRIALSGLQQRDAAFANGMLVMLGLGFFSYAARQWAQGKDPTKNPNVWIGEALDKSGLLFWAYDVNNVIERSTGVGLKSLTGGPIQSRFSTRGLLEQVAGPTGAAVGDLGSVVAGVLNKPSRRDVRAARRLLPFQNLFYLNWLFDSMQEGTADALGLPRSRRDAIRERSGFLGARL